MDTVITGSDDSRMTQFIILVLVIGTALAFDFTNGFHDTGNAMATSIATGALKPKVAVALSGVLNLVGALLSVQVAKTVSKVVDIQDKNGAPVATFSAPGGHQLLMTIIFAGLVGGIIWNLVTWLLGLPSSSSHALFGGLIGATIAGLGFSSVNWLLVLTSIVVPALLSPFVALLIASVGTFLIYRVTRRTPDSPREKGFRWGQVGSASLVSLAHGTGDAQKTMGVVFLALVANGSLSVAGDIPLWVKLCCAVAISLGTFFGGWRVIRTLGKGLVEISSLQGMAAESGSAAVILTSSHLGLALSTTQVATGSILGTGVGRKGATVRWNVAGRMAAGWTVTMPVAGVIGAVCFFLADLLKKPLDGLLGFLLDFAILVFVSSTIYRRSRKAPVDASNVNADWDDSTLALPPDAPAGTPDPRTSSLV